MNRFGKSNRRVVSWRNIGSSLCRFSDSQVLKSAKWGTAQPRLMADIELRGSETTDWAWGGGLAAISLGMT